ncbi:MAG: hypothetical protein KatS3mg105_1226 [Gemmatales bacterium]|nr:MAG: hypothetical protein KatS3mg105_1226 [Gemmatales bacterium]
MSETAKPAPPRPAFDQQSQSFFAEDGASRTAQVQALRLLHYRPWRGECRPAFYSVWPVARVSLRMMFRRKLFWGLYALALIIFLMFFFGQYLLAWAESQSASATVNVGLVRTNPSKLIRLLRDALKLNGSADTYRNFFRWQGSMVMIVLALAGALIVGNDFRHRSLPFYLSKPIRRWHYVAGKCLAVAVFVNLMTTLPALVLFVQYGLLDDWGYFVGDGTAISLGFVRLVLPINSLCLGIVGYGVLLTVCLSLFLVATASWLRRTVPLIMAWTTLFFFLRMVARALVDGLHYDPRWRLLDLWNCLSLLGNRLLGIPAAQIRPQPQPEIWEAAATLAALCVVCLLYLNHRIRGVEVVH